MLRMNWVCRVAVGLALAAGLQAQTPGDSATALAEREYANERYRQLRDMAERLSAAQVSLAAKLESLKAECRRLQEETARRPNQYLTREDLKPLEKRVQEMSAKYEADKREIIGRLERLAKTGPPAAAETKTAPKSSNGRKSKSANKSTKS